MKRNTQACIHTQTALQTVYDQKQIVDAEGILLYNCIIYNMISVYQFSYLFFVCGFQFSIFWKWWQFQTECQAKYFHVTNHVLVSANSFSSLSFLLSSVSMTSEYVCWSQFGGGISKNVTFYALNLHLKQDAKWHYTPWRGHPGSQSQDKSHRVSTGVS